MKTEDLKAMGLTDEQISKVMAENGKDVNAAKADAENLKSEVASLKSQLSSLEDGVAQRDKQLKELKDSAGNNEELKKQINDLQEQNKTMKQEAEAKLNELMKEHAIESELMSSGAINLKAVKALIDAGKISMDDKGISGLKEQLDLLKSAEDSKMLFKSDTVIIDGTKPAPGTDNTNNNTGLSLADAVKARITSN